MQIEKKCMKLLWNMLLKIRNMKHSFLDIKGLKQYETEVVPQKVLLILTDRKSLDIIFPGSFPTDCT